MLYDILIIDDDFSGETVLDELTLSSAAQGNSASWGNTIMPLYFDLTRDNLRVIWSTGEMADLKKFDKYQLSTVKHIICDLHLAGMEGTTNNKTIISKIAGIISKLDGNFGEKNISFLINSKYEHPGIENELRAELNREYQNKYTVGAFSEKNAITDKQKQELLGTSLLSHIKEQVIKKHLEVERCLNERIKIEDTVIENDVLRELSFYSKHKIVKQNFNLNGHNEKIKRLNESRNYIAHTEINLLGELTGIKNLANKNNKIFKNFSDLTGYLDEIDDLTTIVRKAPKK